MTTASSAGGTLRTNPCPNHDAEVSKMGPRSVDMQTFRNTCFELLSTLEGMGPSEDPLKEAERQRVMRTIDGAFEATRCDQTMIITF